MQAFRFKVYEAFLVYPPGQEVHTAASGHVAALHEVFAEASAKRGTSESLTKVLYAGVLFGGPRWEVGKTGSYQSRMPIVKAQAVPTPAAPPPPVAGKTDKQIFDDLKTWIEKEKPTPDQIRKRVDEIRKAQAKPATK